MEKRNLEVSPDRPDSNLSRSISGFFRMLQNLSARFPEYLLEMFNINPHYLQRRGVR